MTQEKVFSRIETEVESKKWKRYEIEIDSFVIEKMITSVGTSKGLRIFNVGHDAIELIARLFNVKIHQNGQTRWIGWTDPNTDIEVTIFE